MKKLRFIAVTLLMAMVMSLFAGCMVKMEVPTVTEGRFDFSVTYAINGEEQTYNGVYVCQYEGISVALDGKGRAWSGYIENGNQEGLLEIQNNDDGKIYIDFSFNPLYFMADPDYELFETPTPKLLLVYHSDDPDYISIGQDIDFLADYGVELIDYTYADPIENSYKEQWNFGAMEMGIN